uniref:Uncharacterized protein n=1 Tax=Kwoniella bestiolae CBS 10118 TaxID=1296100 RepID=A0A1B9FZG5_9TREE|nr:hypothetical protein I302_05619 [Kwoniella bestiolae CBS 10118]OCF24160.1 hypothetical protein I302_05619 [Kwoniella bestiolae CBS 10118]
MYHPNRRRSHRQRPREDRSWDDHPSHQDYHQSDALCNYNLPRNDSACDEVPSVTAASIPDSSDFTGHANASIHYPTKGSGDVNIQQDKGMNLHQIVAMNKNLTSISTNNINLALQGPAYGEDPSAPQYHLMSHLNRINEIPSRSFTTQAQYDIPWDAHSLPNDMADNDWTVIKDNHQLGQAYSGYTSPQTTMITDYSPVATVNTTWPLIMPDSAQIRDDDTSISEVVSPRPFNRDL